VFYQCFSPADKKNAEQRPGLETKERDGQAPFLEVA
jgi:hypothetical protein